MNKEILKIRYEKNYHKLKINKSGYPSQFIEYKYIEVSISYSNRTTIMHKNWLYLKFNNKQHFKLI